MNVSLSFAEQRFQIRQQRMRDDFRAFRRGMNAVRLDCSRHVDQVFVDHGNESDVMPCGEVLEKLIERLDVIGAVVGRQGNSGEKSLDMRSFKSREDLVEIATGLFERQSAKPIVTAEFDNHHIGVKSQDSRKPGNCIFGCGPAGALVDHLVVITFGIEYPL